MNSVTDEGYNSGGYARWPIKLRILVWPATEYIFARSLFQGAREIHISGGSFYAYGSSEGKTQIDTAFSILSSRMEPGAAYDAAAAKTCQMSRNYQSRDH
jgi:hypothetical protein